MNMKIPYPVCTKVSKEIIRIWNRVYAKSKGTSNDKTVEESLWRRTQDVRNKNVSGWKNINDKRRKVVYYRHEYDLLQSSDGAPLIGLVGTYVYICLTLPRNEIKEYKKLINNSLKRGNWELCKISSNLSAYRYEDLLLDIIEYGETLQHPFEYDEFPEKYQSLEIKLYSKNIKIDEKLLKKPWVVLRSGLRRKLERRQPKYLNNPKYILKFLPAQIELGCGPSYEAGVPPLHELHYCYSINEPLSKKFIIKASKDLFFNSLISNTESKYIELTGVFAKIINAKLTNFYSIINKLFHYHYLVGPVITNNFDGLHLRFGRDELYVRKYEESTIVPKINFHPLACSLIVIGSHADRRFVQESARQQGLKVIYVDPEGWWINNKFFSYPLESPQDQDIVFKRTASEFFLEFEKEIMKHRTDLLHYKES